MQHLEVSGAVQHIYVIRRLKVKHNGTEITKRKVETKRHGIKQNKCLSTKRSHIKN